MSCMKQLAQVSWCPIDATKYLFIFFIAISFSKGGFAKVKLATHTLTGEKVAIKIMDKKALGVIIFWHFFLKLLTNEYWLQTLKIRMISTSLDDHYFKDRSNFLNDLSFFKIALRYDRSNRICLILDHVKKEISNLLNLYILVPKK